MPRPEWVDAFIQSSVAFLRHDLAPAFSQVVRVWWERRLHAHLDRFEGAEEDVGDEFGGSAGAEVDDGLGGVGEEFLAVVVLEDFVGTVLSGALEGVADEGRGPAEADTTHAVGTHDPAPCLEVAGVHLGVDLSSAFHEVERRDGCVGRATGDDAAYGACCEVCPAEQFNLLRRVWRRRGLLGCLHCVCHSVCRCLVVCCRPVVLSMRTQT